MGNFPIIAMQCGKSQLQVEVIRAYAYPTGLPRMNFVLATGLKLVRWDKDTGEVSTIKQDYQVWMDEQ